jgi:cation-transporting ATPase 13A3/4/5
MSALLPTVFVVFVGISQNRLLEKRIACSNPESVLVAGKVNKALSDKTGTLTKQGLDFLSARSRENWNNDEDKSISGFLATGMTCCHTLTCSPDWQLCGQDHVCGCWWHNC